MIEESEYIKGFDHGQDFILAEIERYIKLREQDSQTVEPVKKLVDYLRAFDFLGISTTKKM